MKKFVKSNKAITIIAVISFLICVSYCITYKMPDYIGIAAWYSFLNNVCISYLAAVIFYIVQVHIPKVNYENKAKISVRDKMYDIYCMLKLTSVAYEKYVRINDEGGATINWDSSLGKEYIFLRYSCSCGKDDSMENIRGYTRSEILELDKKYKNKIEQIMKSSYNRYFSDSFIELLNAMNLFDGYKNINTIIEYKDTFVVLTAISNLPDKIEKLVAKIDKEFSFEHEFVLQEVTTSGKIIAELTKKMPLSNTSLEELNDEIRKKEIEEQIRNAFKDKGIVLDENIYSDIIKQIQESEKER